MQTPNARGCWSKDQIAAFLSETTVPMRLACTGASGFPVLASLWYVQRGEKLWCATQRSARVVAHLRRDPRCAFEIARETAPYSGLRGQGIATLRDDRGEEILRTLVDRYLDDPSSAFASWLLDRADREMAIEIEPRTLFTWDYRDRMGPG